MVVVADKWWCGCGCGCGCGGGCIFCAVSNDVAGSCFDQHLALQRSKNSGNLYLTKKVCLKISAAFF